MAATTIPAVEAKRLTNGSAKTVLVVEDNVLNMKLFHDLLQAYGYNVLQTGDGMEAVRVLGGVGVGLFFGWLLWVLL
jgi:response regulator RpfG family c-di-GMP phosphodiesterase